MDDLGHFGSRPILSSRKNNIREKMNMMTKEIQIKIDKLIQNGMIENIDFRVVYFSSSAEIKFL